MIIAVTGGTGFVGRYLVKELVARGHKVRILTRKNVSVAVAGVEYYKGSLDDVCSLTSFVDGVDVVCHCAGEISDQSKFVITNFIGTKNIFSVCKNRGVKRFIQLSSVGVYGAIDSGSIDESHELRAMNDYEASKIASDQWLLKQKNHAVEICLLRPSAVLGIDMPNNSIRQLVDAIRKRVFFLIGKNYLASYISIENLTRALVLIVEYPGDLHNKIYNLSDSITWEDILGTVSRALSIKRRCVRIPKNIVLLVSHIGVRLLGNKFPLKESRVTALSKRTIYDSTAISDDLGYSAQNTLSQSLESYIRTWYNQPSVETGVDLKLARVATSPSFLLTQLHGQIMYLNENSINIDLISSPGAELNAFTWGDALRHKSICIEREIRPYKDFVALIKLFLYFKKNKFDIVHSSTPKAGLLCVIAAFMARSPVVMHSFTGQVWATKKGLKRFILKCCDKLIVKLTDAVYADSDSQAKFLLKNKISKSSDKISVLADGSLAGVDLKRFDIKFRNDWRKKIRSNLSISNEDFVFVFAGRIKKDKGVFDLLDSFENIQSANLLICGPNEIESPDLNRRFLSQIESLDRVHYLGNVENPEHYFSAADVLVLPSYREGFGTVVIEAAAMGVPAIGSRIPGLTDAIIDGETGILFEKGNVTDLCSKMKLCCDERSYVERLGVSAHERVSSNFSLEYISSLQLKEYKKLLGI